MITRSLTSPITTAVVNKKLVPKGIGILVPFFEITNGVLVKQGGVGTWANNSTTAKTFIDNTGRIVKLEAGEIIRHGARRRHNFIYDSEDVQVAQWNKVTGCTVSSATLINLSADLNSRLQDFHSAVGGGLSNDTFVFRAVLWVDSGTVLMRLRIEHELIAFHVSSNITVTTTPTSHEFIATLSSSLGSGNLISAFVQPTGGTGSSAKSFHATDISLERQDSFIDYFANSNTDHGYGVRGVKYFDTDALGDPIVPTPAHLFLPHMVNTLHPSITTTVGNYSTRSNFQNKVVSQNIFKHAVEVVTAGVESTLYHNDLAVTGSTFYTLVVWCRMADGSAPRPALSTTDTNGDFSPVIGGSRKTSTVANGKATITKFGDIYCVMMFGQSASSPPISINNGIRQYTGQSDKKFEVYSLGMLIGSHLFPVFLPAVNAAFNWNTDSYTISSTDNVFQDHGIVLLKYKPTQVAGLSGLLTLNASIESLLYNNSNFSSDDETTVTEESTAYANDDDILLALNFKGTQKEIMVSVNGAAFNSSGATDYDGGFDLTGGVLQLGRSTIAVMLFSSIRIYHDGLAGGTLAGMNAWVKANADAETS